MASLEGPPGIDDLRACAGKTVRLRLDDGTQFVGTLRTELLSDRSISVFLTRDGGGATIYIDRIATLDLA